MNLQQTSLLYYHEYQKFKFIRYAGGKNRLLKFLIPKLPNKNKIAGSYIEPFVGSGAVFFCLNPRKAILSDTNRELIDLYRGLKSAPEEVWKLFEDFPRTKRSYYQIRSGKIDEESLPRRAARVLFLNRTCFKGMWRYNQDGEFNVGYGGQDRRWVINLDNLLEVSKRLRRARLLNCDFEEIIDNSERGDFIFLDPPYSPGCRETRDYHYNGYKFTFEDQNRLARTLKRASRRGVKWAMTTSAHPDILDLYRSYNRHDFILGSSEKIGVLAQNTGEILINNYSKI